MARKLQRAEDHLRNKYSVEPHHCQKKRTGAAPCTFILSARLVGGKQNVWTLFVFPSLIPSLSSPRPPTLAIHGETNTPLSNEALLLLSSWQYSTLYYYATDKGFVVVVV